MKLVQIEREPDLESGIAKVKDTFSFVTASYSEITLRKGTKVKFIHAGERILIDLKHPNSCLKHLQFLATKVLFDEKFTIVERSGNNVRMENTEK